MTSLSRRIIVATVALTAVSVGLAGTGVWLGARWQLIAAIDASVQTHLARIDRLLRAGRLPTPVPRVGPADAHANVETVFFQLFDADTGRELVRSTSMDDRALSLTTLLTDRDQQVPRWIRFTDGRELRAMAMTIEAPPPPVPVAAVPGQPEPVAVPARSLVLMAVDASAMERELGRFAIMLSILWVTACGLAVLASGWLRRAILKPVHRLAGAIRAIDLDRLPERIEADVPAEMLVMRERLDDLLRRLAQVLDREKGTIANVAHELRTPIAALRTTLEFTALAPAVDGRQVAARCLPTVIAMQGMVANLLTLARIEAGQEVVRWQAVDLAGLVEGCWASLEPLASQRRSRLLAITGERPQLIRSCSDQARMVVANLLDNAISHSPGGSAIAVGLKVKDGDVHLDISNPIDGSAPDPAALFQPFWRGDTARSGSGLHCGLGLALCRRLLTLLGGSITADTSQPHRFRIEVRFPSAVESCDPAMALPSRA